MKKCHTKWVVRLTLTRSLSPHASWPQVRPYARSAAKWTPEIRAFATPTAERYETGPIATLAVRTFASFVQGRCKAETRHGHLPEINVCPLQPERHWSRLVSIDKVQRERLDIIPA